MSAIDGTVVVDGATGYLGSHLIDRLCQLKAPVRAVVHPLAKELDLKILRERGAQVVTVDLSQNDVERTAAAIAGCESVVHLIGSVAPKKGESLFDLHVSQTQNMVNACKLAGVKKIVMITTLGAKANADNSYQATKSKAEEVITAGGIDYTILRPPLLIGRTFGHRDSKLVNRFREIILEKKLVPLINGGQNKIQPLFVGDLVSAIVRCLQSDSPSHFEALDIAGPEILSMKQFIELLMASCGVTKPIVALPIGVANLIASVCETFQQVPLVSGDQVKLASVDNICIDNAMTTKLGMQLTPVKRALESYNKEGAELAALS